MAAIANVVLTDGASTPVDHTFTPSEATPQASKWHNRAGGIDIGMPVLSAAKRREGPVNKVTLQLLLPVLEAVDGANPSGFTPAPQVAYTVRGDVSLFLPVRCTKQNRKDLRVMLTDLLAEAMVVSLCDDLESPY